MEDRLKRIKIKKKYDVNVISFAWKIMLIENLLRFKPHGWITEARMPTH